MSSHDLSTQFFCRYVLCLSFICFSLLRKTCIKVEYFTRMIMNINSLLT